MISKLHPALSAAVFGALLCMAGPAPARESNAQADAEALEALRAEMAEARTALADAGRQMAEIQRKLGRSKLHERLADPETLAALEKAGSVDFERIRVLTDDSLEHALAMPPRLGVLLAPGEEGDARTIIGVTPGSGADKAGIRAGDTIVAVNGHDIDTRAGESIREALDGVQAGDTVPVTVLRDGTEEAFDVETSSVKRDIRMIVRGLDDMPELEIDKDIRVFGLRDGPRPPRPPMPPHFSALGADADLVGNHPGLARYFGTADGVIVLRIADDNPMNLRDGDVILSVAGESVSGPVDLARSLMQREPGETVSIELMRDGARTGIEATIPERAAHAPRIGHVRLRTPRIPEAPPAPEAPKPPPREL